MDGLLTIGQSHRPNAILRRASASAQAIADGEAHGSTKVRLLDRTDGQASQSTPVPASNATTVVSNTSDLCAICRQRRSSYLCPQCNIPYCSLACFRHERHGRCAIPFAQKAMRNSAQEAQQQKGGEGGGGLDAEQEEERKKMMDILHRLRHLDDKVSKATRVSAGKEKVGKRRARAVPSTSTDSDGEWSDVEVNNVEIDLDGATMDELLAMLTVEERTQFDEQIRQASTAGPEGGGLVATLLEGDNGTQSSANQAWWEQDATDISVQQPQVSSTLIDSIRRIASALNTEESSKETLLWNVVSLVLVYTFTLQHFDVKLLANLEETERTAAVDLLYDLAPFLHSTGAEARIVLKDAEDVSMALVSRLGPRVGSNADELLLHLYRRAWPILQVSKVQMVGQETSLLLFAVITDLRPLLARLDRRKLDFYAAQWIVQPREPIEAGLLAEMQRLEGEIQRGQDQERWQAAHEAMEGHTVDQIHLPSRRAAPSQSL